jgi:hypothetical protein
MLRELTSKRKKKFMLSLWSRAIKGRFIYHNIFSTSSLDDIKISSHVVK